MTAVKSTDFIRLYRVKMSSLYSYYDHNFSNISHSASFQKQLGTVYDIRNIVFEHLYGEDMIRNLILTSEMMTLIRIFLTTTTTLACVAALGGLGLGLFRDWGEGRRKSLQ